MTDLQLRIRAAYAESREYHDMLKKAFPEDIYPRAWRTSSNGGPPGCAMAFGAALRRMGGRREGHKVWLPADPAGDAAAAFAGMMWKGNNEPPNYNR